MFASNMKGNGKYNWMFCWIILSGFIALQSEATCGENFDKIRKRRIEAIRGQILSKLGKTELPNNNKPTTLIPLPKNIEKMYNRTRDFLLSEARRKRQECSEPEESYYAQDIIVLNATQPPREAQTGKSSSNKNRNTQKKKHQSRFVYFDLTSSEIDPDSIVSSTLRLYQIQTPNFPHGGKQQVSLYQLTPSEIEGTTPHRRFIAMKMLSAYDEGWKSFDITSVTREWARISKLNLGLELIANCKEEPIASENTKSQHNQTFQVTFAGTSMIDQNVQPSRGDQTDQMQFLENHLPHLIVMMRSHNSRSSKSKNRKKRSLDADYCFRRNPSETNCCLRELFIDFRKDLGWKWIQAPSGYKANYCAGACPYLWSTDTQHSTILGLYHSMNPQASSAPCCSPKDLEPIMIMYYDRGRYRFTQLSDVLVTSCRCN